ncbi:MAG TPA: hypothetical protein VNT75_04505 [Symbiobacteriaceae bacterium]|nr:hypothetical protein [Symbiobacteriaceae bacterium]
MPLWTEPELCLVYKGVRVYREFPNRYVCFTGTGAAAGREVPQHRILGVADLLTALKALIDGQEIG